MNIFEAVRFGDIDKVSLFLTDVKLKDNSGNSLLHLACHNGHLSVVRLLLQSNVIINSTNEYGNTPLHFASHRGYSDIIDILLTNGANIELKNTYTRTPLDLAENTQVRELLTMAMKKEIVWDLWILESYDYNSYFQWLPREMAEDVLFTWNIYVCILSFDSIFISIYSR